MIIQRVGACGLLAVGVLAFGCTGSGTGSSSSSGEPGTSTSSSGSMASSAAGSGSGSSTGQSSSGGSSAGASSVGVSSSAGAGSSSAMAVAPDTVLDSVPAAVSNLKTPAFQFSCTGGGCTFTCTLDTGSPTACTSPFTTPTLQDGAHTFSVTASRTGLVDATPAQHAWTVDATPPDLSLTAGPALSTALQDQDFQLACSETGCLLDCTLDGQAVMPCVLPTITLTALEDGAHALVVVAKDAAGNQDPTPLTVMWTVDTVPPTATILTGPAMVSNIQNATFTFSSNETGAVFQCALDAAMAAPCTSPAVFNAVPEGAHSFLVSAQDAAGNMSSVVSRSFEVDRTAPNTTVTGAPSGTTVSTQASLDLACDEAACTYRCATDGAGAVACVSPLVLTALGDGTHIVEVSAQDAAGNSDASPTRVQWVVDTTGPAILLGQHPDTFINTTTTAIAFTCDDSPCTQTCQVDSGNAAACVSPFQVESLAEGTHRVTIHGVDALGNVGPAMLVDFTVDLTAPVTTVTSSPASHINATSASISFQCNEAAGCTFLCSLDSAAPSSCTSPKVLMGLSDGPHVLQVLALDRATNVEAAGVGVPFIVDTVPPQTTFTRVPQDPSGFSNDQVTFTANEAGCVFSCALDGATPAACTSPLALTSLAEGPHTLAVTTTDLAGNVGQAISTTWTVDTLTPDTSLAGGPAPFVNVTTASFTLGCSKMGCVFTCSLDGQPGSTCTSPVSLTGLAEGPHTFQAQAKDAALNLDPTPASHAWTVDQTLPLVSITSAPPAIGKSTNASVGLGSNEPGTFLCALDGAVAVACVSPVTASNVAEGPHSLVVNAVDRAGNVSVGTATATWTVDITEPDTALSDKPPTFSNSTAPSFSFNSTESGSTFACELDGVGFTTCTSPTVLAGLAQGVHVFKVRATDPAGNTDNSPTSHTWTVDTAAPDTALLTGPAAISNVATPSFTFSSGDGTATFECSLDGAAFAGCFSPRTYTGVAAGSHSFAVRAVDPATNVDATPATQVWTVDLSPPDTFFTSQPANPTNLVTATFAFDATEPGCVFQCELDGGGFANCTSPRALTGLTEGAHTFKVRAQDPAGNVDASPMQVTWTVDFTPPDTTIVTKPANRTNATTGAFTFSSPDAGATFECDLDNGGFAVCVSPASYPGLLDGSHTFKVRARDVATNVDATPATATWTVDTVVPDTVLLTHPVDPTNITTATFTFNSPDGTAAFECQLDGGGFTTCTSGKNYTGLGAATHVFMVRARDVATNIDATPATFTWVVDLTVPGTSITAGPANPTNITTATFSFTSPDATATFECDLDNGGFSACTTGKNYTGLAAGPHTFSVRARDPATNVDATPATFPWTVDLTAPDTSITAGPANPTNATTATFSFTSPDATATFECDLDNGGFSACTTGKNYTGLAAGPHTFSVQARDPATNVDATPATFLWTVDLTPPDTTLLTHPAAAANTGAASFTFSSGDATASFECSLDGGAFAACTSPKNYAGLLDGSHTFDVRAVDPATNVDATPASFSWTVDATAPQTTFTSVPAAVLNSGYFTFQYQADETATFQCKLDGGTFAACGAFFDVQALQDGAHTFMVRAVDAVGNVDATPASHTWTVDTVPPLTQFTTAPGAVFNGDTTSVDFTANEMGVTYACSLDNAAYATCTPPVALSGLAAHTGHRFAVRGTDVAGNVEYLAATLRWVSNWTATNISHTGTYRNCAVAGVTGDVLCWGDANYLGDGSESVPAAVPTRVQGLPGAFQVAVGEFHTCAVSGANNAYCWGPNYFGQVGNGTTSGQALTATQVVGLPANGVTKVVAGYDHACALTSLGAVKCWGSNAQGQLGSAGANTGTPRDVTGLGTVVDLDANGYHTCAVVSGGNVYCWGANGNGQLGDGSLNASATPVGPVLAVGSQLSLGVQHTCVVTTANTIQCWGDNTYGQVGDNTPATFHNTPQAVVGLPLVGVGSVSSGLQHSCALGQDNQVYCWGRNDRGQVLAGYPTSARAAVATTEFGGLTPAAVVATSNHTTVRDSTGVFWVLGSNDGAQLGAGILSDQPSVTLVPGITAVTGVSLGNHHTCAVAGTNTRCWGLNSNGQAGDGTTVDREVPVDVPGMAGITAEVAAGLQHTCARTTGGTVKCWGNGGAGALGNGSYGSSLVPVDVSGLANVVQVASGHNHVCARNNVNAAFCWGMNSGGQLGDGTNTSANVPVAVVGLGANVTSIAASAYTTCAVVNGGVKCWGTGTSGELGTGVLADSNVPVDVPGMSTGWVDVKMGASHSCARSTTGVVRCWGYGSEGQLGATPVVPFTPAPPVALPAAAMSISTVGYTSCALLADNTTWCWGMGYHGELGQGRFLPGTNVVPRKVLGGVTFTGLGSGTGATVCGFNAANALYCWGSNDSGALGMSTAWYVTRGPRLLGTP